MFRPRIIPTLLLQDDYLVKTVKFKNPNYIGDPINAVRIFNDLKADELVFLDIDATKKGKLINLEFVKQVGEEANMPFSVGGGIKTIEDIRNIIAAGAERVIIGAYAVENTDFIKKATDVFGSSTVAVCVDFKKKFFGGFTVCTHNGKKTHKFNPIDFSLKMEELGVGELIIQSIDNDGLMNGYNYDLLKQISEAVTIPVVALGGAGNYLDLKKCYTQSFVSGVAAGSLFVYNDSNKGVLINYPENKQDLF